MYCVMFSYLNFQLPFSEEDFVCFAFDMQIPKQGLDNL